MFILFFKTNSTNPTNSKNHNIKYFLLLYNILCVQQNQLDLQL